MVPAVSFSSEVFLYPAHGANRGQRGAAGWLATRQARPVPSCWALLIPAAAMRRRTWQAIAALLVS